MGHIGAAYSYGNLSLFEQEFEKLVWSIIKIRSCIANIIISSMRFFKSTSLLCPPSSGAVSVGAAVAALTQAV